MVNIRDWQHEVRWMERTTEATHMHAATQACCLCRRQKVSVIFQSKHANALQVKQAAVGPACQACLSPCFPTCPQALPDYKKDREGSLACLTLLASFARSARELLLGSQGAAGEGEAGSGAAQPAALLAAAALVPPELMEQVGWRVGALRCSASCCRTTMFRFQDEKHELRASLCIMLQVSPLGMAQEVCSGCGVGM